MAAQSADQLVRKQQTEQRCLCYHLSEDDVRRELKRVNVRKAADLMGLLAAFWGPVLISLLVVYFHIYESLATSVVPTSLKKSVIIPVPKNSKPSCLNDYRPVALTSTVMKVFERLLKKHICSSIPATLDPLQFAYRPNRSTDDAISQVLHSSLTHIDSKNGNYVRLLFIDYSSAFNTIVPTKLTVKLSDLGLNTSLCDWIQDFLTARPQWWKSAVHLHSITPEHRSPTGLCPEPTANSLYTTTACPHTAPLPLLNLLTILWFWASFSNNDEAAYLDEVERLTHGVRTTVSLWTWAKTKELIVDFRRGQQRPYTPLMINGTPVERVSRLKYLGCKQSPRTWHGLHTFKHRLRKPGKDCTICDSEGIQVFTSYPENFLFRGIESVLTQCISVWYGNSSNQDCKSSTESRALSWAHLRVCSPLSAGHLPQTLQKQGC